MKKLINWLRKDIWFWVSILFFVVINTSYYWNFWIKSFIILLPVLLSLTLVYFIILTNTIYRIYCVTIKQSYSLYKRKRDYNLQVTKTIIMVIFLSLITYKPEGFINFEVLEEKAFLIATAKGAANCTTTLKLRENGVLKETSVCFGFDKHSGTYKICNDTIYFQSDADAWISTYKFAIVCKDKYKNDLLLMHPKRQGEMTYFMQIRKNDLKININVSFTS